MKVAIERARTLELLRNQLIDVRPGTDFARFLKSELKAPITNGVFIKTKSFNFHVTIDGLMGRNGFEDGCAIEYCPIGKPDSGTRSLLNTAGILKFDLKRTLEAATEEIDEDVSKRYSENIAAAVELMDAIFLLSTKFFLNAAASAFESAAIATGVVAD